MAAVRSVHSSVNRFIHLFDVDEKESLTYLSSGMTAAESIADSVLSVDYKGEEQFNEFVLKSLVEKEISVHKPIKRHI